jgi:hypothetical protein
MLSVTNKLFMLIVIMLIVIMLIIIMLNVIMLSWKYLIFRNVINAECHLCWMLLMLGVTYKPFMMSVIMPKVIMLSVIMLNVVAPFELGKNETCGQCYKTFYGRKLRLYKIS